MITIVDSGPANGPTTKTYSSIWGHIIYPYVSICGPMETSNIYNSNNINNMKVKKEIPVDQSIIDEVNKKYPGMPFTRWAEMAFKEKIDNDNSEAPTNDPLIDQRLTELEDKINKFIDGFKSFKERTNNHLGNIDNRFDELENK